MKTSKLIQAGVALLICAVLPVSVSAADDIPPISGFASNGYANFYLEPTPEETLILQPSPSDSNEEDDAGNYLEIFRFEAADNGAPSPDGVSVGNIEDSPAIRMNTNTTAGTSTGNIAGTNNAANNTAGGNANTLAGTNNAVNNTAGGNADTLAGTNNAANNNAGGNAGTLAGTNTTQDQALPLANEHPNTGRPSMWPTMIGAILMLGSIPVILQKRAKK